MTNAEIVSADCAILYFYLIACSLPDDLLPYLFLAEPNIIDAAAKRATEEPNSTFISHLSLFIFGTLKSKLLDNNNELTYVTIFSKFCSLNLPGLDPTISQENTKLLKIITDFSEIQDELATNYSIVSLICRSITNKATLVFSSFYLYEAVNNIVQKTVSSYKDSFNKDSLFRRETSLDNLLKDLLYLTGYSTLAPFISLFQKPIELDTSSFPSFFDDFTKLLLNIPLLPRLVLKVIHSHYVMLFPVGENDISPCLTFFLFSFIQSPKVASIYNFPQVDRSIHLLINVLL